MSYIRTTLCIVLVIAIASIAPVAVAGPQDDDPPWNGHVAEDKCYVIQPTEFPPVAVYDCPGTG